MILFVITHYNNNKRVFLFKVLSLCLSSRRNLCIHPRVMQQADREGVDSACRDMTASWVRARAEKAVNNNDDSLCEFFESYASGQWGFFLFHQICLWS